MFITESPAQIEARKEEARLLWEEKVLCVQRIAQINKRLTELKVNPHKV